MNGSFRITYPWAEMLALIVPLPSSSEISYPQIKDRLCCTHLPNDFSKLR
jgi:hypothetical protein